MKYTRQILMALFCIFFTVNALATSVTKNNAAKVATNYFSEVLISNGMSHAAVISETFDIKKDGNTVLYVFNFENGGYVIVSADDRFTPIIGYSPDGFYQKDNMAEGFEYLMAQFSDMIALVRAENIAATPEYTAKWERYASEKPAERDLAGTPVVGPLTALWNQDFPYNYYCPIVSGGPGGRAYAGCVATAMSMIMYYWRWPWQGVGERSYKPSSCHGVSFPVLTAKFGETTYDFNGMYGTPEKAASGYMYEPLSLLQYHAGISVDMAYCSDGSGTQSAKVPNAMKSYFKYDQSIQHVQYNKDLATWTAMLKGQLDLKQPVYVSGIEVGANAGHAFVCDGYDTDNKYHYNFGWDGSSNGYFAADKPAEFSNPDYLAAVINFKPDRSKGYPADCNGNWTLPYLKGMLADCSGPMDKYAAGTTATWLLDPTSVGIAAEKYSITCESIDLATGDYLRIYDGDNDSAPLLGEFTGKTPFNKITSTGGKVLVKFTSTATSATGEGFLITYESKAKKYCDGEIKLTSPTGIITDGSPEGMNYANGSDCKWVIDPGAVDPETQFIFNFNRLDTEEKVDVLKFYNVETSKLLATISGTYAPEETPQIIAKARKVAIIFSSNSYISGKGFEIEYFTDPVSIKEVENINDLSIYPNPASDKLNVKFNTSDVDDFNIVIYNVTGQAVYRELLNKFTGSYYKELNINDFAQGVYLMQIKSSRGTTTRKVVVQ